MRRGTAALDESRRVAEQAMSGGGPWRFFLKDNRLVEPVTKTEDNPQGIPSNECGIILLDHRLEDIPGFPEHNLKIGGKWGNFEICPSEWATCPLCDQGDRAYYVCMFSALVLRPWKSKDGKKQGPATKMLLPVKSSSMGKFEEILRAAVKRNGQLRGTFLYMKRDLGNRQSPAIGEPSILDNGSLFDFYTEDELVESFGHDAEKSPQGKLLKPENDDITPFDYDALFKKPDVAALRQRYGGRVQAGSREEAEASWGDDQDGGQGDEDDDELPGMAEAPPANHGRGKAGAAPQQQRSAPSRRGPAQAAKGSDPFEEA